MADYIKTIQTADGPKQIDYESLANLPGSAKDGGYYTPKVTQPDTNTMRVSYAPSDAGMSSVEPVDIVLPAGPSGNDGTSPTVTVSRNAAGTGAVISVVNAEGAASEAEVLDGKDGNPGATPNIQIGTVETLPAGSEATANITGTLENPRLNLGIPQGTPAGDGDGDIGLGITGAAVGQIARITAVDDEGKPTAWEPVDLPDGGDETWDLLADITPSESVGVITATGEWSAYKKIRIAFYGITETANEGYLYINGHYSSAHKTAPSLKAAYRSYYGVLEWDPALEQLVYSGFAVGSTWAQYALFGSSVALEGYQLFGAQKDKYPTMPTITSVSAYVYNDVFLDGTRLMIWGCKQ